MCTIAVAKVQPNYNCYNVYFNGCLPSYHFPRIFHLLPEHCTKYHLDILDEGVVVVVVAVQAHLIGIDDRIIIFYRNLLHRAESSS